MTDSNNTVNSALDQKLALQIIVGVGASAQPILHPVADEHEALALMEKIQKTPGFFILAKDSGAPVMFHVRHVIMVQIVLLPSAPIVSKIAKLN